MHIGTVTSIAWYCSASSSPGIVHGLHIWFFFTSASLAYIDHIRNLRWKRWIIELMNNRVLRLDWGSDQLSWEFHYVQVPTSQTQKGTKPEPEGRFILKWIWTLCRQTLLQGNNKWRCKWQCLEVQLIVIREPDIQQHDDQTWLTTFQDLLLVCHCCRGRPAASLPCRVELQTCFACLMGCVQRCRRASTTCSGPNYAATGEVFRPASALRGIDRSKAPVAVQPAQAAKQDHVSVLCNS